MSEDIIPPAADAEVFTVTVTDDLLKKGDHDVKLDDYSSNVDGAQDVTIVDSANTDIEKLEIAKLGKDDDADDVIRFDLSTFDDDFTIKVKSEETNDLLVIEDVESVVDNGDGTYTVTYIGADGLTHTAEIDPDTAQVEFVDATPPGPDGVAENTTFVADLDLTVTCPTGGVEEFCSFKDSDGKPATITFSYDFGTGIEQDVAGEKHAITTAATQPDGEAWDEVYIVVTDKKGVVQFEGAVTRGESFDVQGTKSDGTFQSETYFTIYDFEGGPVLQDINIHTSCSDPTSTQDRFGSITIESATLESGRVLAGAQTFGEPDIVYSLEGVDADLFTIDADTGVVNFKEAPNFEQPQDEGGDNIYDFTVVARSKHDAACVTRHDMSIEVTDEEEFCILENTNDPFSTSIVVDCPEFNDVPQDLCMFKSAGDKPVTLQMVYDFGTGIEQVVAGEKHEILTAATQPDGAAWDEVYIVVKDKNGIDQFEGAVARGETFEISGTKHDGSFESETYFEIYDFQGGPLLQEINVHTSCSDPTNTTDRFGSITLAGATLESGATISGYTNTQYSGDALSYTLAGPDAHLFEVDENGKVTFKDAPDFENPLDVDGDNEYVVVVRGTIPGTDKFEEQTLVICVKDDDDVTTISGRVFFDENQDGLEADVTTVITPQPDEVRAISIENKSFEASGMTDDHYNSTISGWTTNNPGMTGEWNPTDWEFADGVTCGLSAAWIEGAGTSISQTLTELYNDAATYEFKIDIGDSSWDDNEDFSIRIFAGAAVIAMATGNTGAGDDFETITLSTAGVSNAALNGEALRVEITNDSGSWIYVDNVRGTVTTPQPDLVTEVVTEDPPFAGAVIQLVDVDGAQIVIDGVPVETVSAADGTYSFEGIPAGDYRIKVLEPQNHDFTLQDVGDDDTIDSDVSQTTGVSDVISISDGQTIANTDVGVIFNPDLAPDAVDDTVRIDEDTETHTVNIINGTTGGAPDDDLGADDDPDGDNENLVVTSVVVDGEEMTVGETFTITDSNDRSVQVTVQGDGDLTVEGPSGFDDTGGQNGTFTLTYEITDDQGLTDTATVTIEVEDLAEAPVANPDEVTTDESSEGGETFNVITGDDSTGGGGVQADTDPDGGDNPVLTVTHVRTPTGGEQPVDGDGVDLVLEDDKGRTVTVHVDSDGSVTIIDVDGFENNETAEDGVFTFEYRIEDTQGETSDFTQVTVNVTDFLEPDAVDDVIHTNEDTDVGGVNIISATTDGVADANLGQDTDPDGDDADLTVTSANGQTIAPGGTTSFTLTETTDTGVERSVLVTVGSDGSVSVSAITGFDETGGDDEVFSFSYEITDAQNTTDTATVSINVADLVEPVAPDAQDDQISTEEYVAVSGVNIIAGTTDGLADPALGADTDPDGDDTALRVNSANGQSIVEGGSTTFTLSETSEDGDVRTVEVTVNSNGSVTVGAMSGFDATDADAQFTFGYEIIDPQGLTDTATVTINVADLVEPIANHDAVVTDEQTDITLADGVNVITGSGGPGVVADNDPDGLIEDLTVSRVFHQDALGNEVTTVVDGPTQFTVYDGDQSVDVTIDADGSLTTSNPQGFDGAIIDNGDFTFKYEVTDKDGLVSNQAEVSLTINDILDQPTGPEINVAFVIDASGSAMLPGSTSSYFNAGDDLDLNNDGRDASLFDGSLAVTLDIIAELQSYGFSDVDLGFYSFESQREDRPENVENAVALAVAGTEGEDGIWSLGDETGITDIANAFETAKFGDNPNNDNGVAYFNEALEGAIDFFTKSDDPADGVETINILYVMSDGFGTNESDNTQGGALNDELTILDGFGVVRDTIYFGSPGIAFGSLFIIDNTDIPGSTELIPGSGIFPRVNLVETEDDLAPVFQVLGDTLV